jgi:uncharacterized protein (TIGR02466 family)
MDEPVLRGADPLFASPLLRFALPQAAGLNALLLAEIAALQAASPGIAVSNRHGWHSALDFFRRPEPGCAALAAQLRAATAAATRQVAPGFDLAAHATQEEGWINVNGPGAYNAPHDHPGWAWSGTYYVAVPEGGPAHAGLLEFLDPRTGANVFAPRGAACFLPKVQLRPRAGELVIFPAFLRHWVTPNETAAPRISVAFNARFVPRPT